MIKTTMQDPTNWEVEIRDDVLVTFSKYDPELNKWVYQRHVLNSVFDIPQLLCAAYERVDPDGGYAEQQAEWLSKGTGYHYEGEMGISGVLDGGKEE